MAIKNIAHGNQIGADFFIDNVAINTFSNSINVIEIEASTRINNAEYCDLAIGKLTVLDLVKSHLAAVPEVKKVIFNAPATIVIWADGSKTVVKAENEDYDPEKGLAMAVVKKVYGNKGNYYAKVFRKWLPKCL